MKPQNRIAVLVTASPMVTPKYEDLTECQKACLYVQGVITEMFKRNEVATSGALDESGMEMFARLKVSGYEPTMDQQRDILEQMLRMGQIIGFAGAAGKAYAEKFWPGRMMLKQPHEDAN